MFGNIGTALQPGSMLTGGSSPNSTGTNIQASSNPAGGLFGMFGSGGGNVGGAAMAPKPATGAGIGSAVGALHPSGLPLQPPGSVNPQLWASILQHLQQTNFQQPAPQHSMQPQPVQQPAPQHNLPMGIPSAIQAIQARQGIGSPQRGWAPLPTQMRPGLTAPTPPTQAY